MVTKRFLFILFLLLLICLTITLPYFDWHAYTLVDRNSGKVKYERYIASIPVKTIVFDTTFSEAIYKYSIMCPSDSDWEKTKTLSRQLIPKHPPSGSGFYGVDIFLCCQITTFLQKANMPVDEKKHILKQVFSYFQNHQTNALIVIYNEYSDVKITFEDLSGFR